MALRLALNRIACPLAKQNFLQKSIIRQKTSFTPIAGWLEKPKSLLFHPENMMKHAEVIPIALITTIGFICEVLYVIRLAFTRDDVVFIGERAACEQIEKRAEKYYDQPIRKMLVIRAKYKLPDGLMTAYEGMGEMTEKKCHYKY